MVHNQFLSMSWIAEREKEKERKRKREGGREGGRERERERESFLLSSVLKALPYTPHLVQSWSLNKTHTTPQVEQTSVESSIKLHKKNVEFLPTHT